MSTEENKLLVRRYLEEVVNTGDVGRLAEFIAPDYVEVYRNVRYPMGLDGARRHVLGGRAVYPDIHVTIERQIAEGDWVVTQITARGTHQGTWLGMKPTGKVLEFTGVNIDKVVDGRIVEHGGAAHLLEPFLDAGAIRVAD
jgi:predicted ester cyclase